MTEWQSICMLLLKIIFSLFCKSSAYNTVILLQLGKVQGELLDGGWSSY